VVIVQLSVLVAISVFAVRLGAYFGCLLVWIKLYGSNGCSDRSADNVASG
jgi:hypothetical protein